MLLETLIEALPEKTVIGPTDHPVRQITHDSRQTRPGDVFVPLRESSGRDGHAFIRAAIEQGAICVIHEQDTPCPGVTSVTVPDTRVALAHLAACFFGYPARRLTLIGVTGTNGKTTTTYLIDAMLRAGGHGCGVIGTPGVLIHGKPRPGYDTHTTPYPMTLHGIFSEMVETGCRFAVMEVSSHGLTLKRTGTLEFKVGVYTNITRDHLDFHRTFEEYREAKKTLFTEYLAPDGFAVINRDDAFYDFFSTDSRGTVISYGKNPESRLTLTRVRRMSPQGSEFELRMPDGAPVTVAIPLPGMFNIYNTMAAFGAASALNLPMEAMLDGVRTVTVPGRMERVETGQPYSVVVDYAHTPDALRNVLASAREWTPGRVIAVFGCGGDRDRGKRPEMGRVGSEYADIVIITSDNPRTEDPGAIIRDIESGIPEGARHSAITDRKTAIRAALDMARPDDTVVIAGKGHEPYQIIGSEKIDFDDRAVVRALLKAG